ncbi:MAG: hypothetical protein JSR56_11745 [Proteobacteria bacterium]|nr:hypothetical protein [Pseudomonadota bacterium]
MIGTWLMVACVAGAFALGFKAWLAWSWHHGDGEQRAHTEYRRLQREHADTAEARLPEAEFVRYRVSMRPGALRYLLAAIALLLVGLPVAYALMAGWPWD